MMRMTNGHKEATCQVWSMEYRSGHADSKQIIFRYARRWSNLPVSSCKVLNGAGGRLQGVWVGAVFQNRQVDTDDLRLPQSRHGSAGQSTRRAVQQIQNIYATNGQCNSRTTLTWTNIMSARQSLGLYQIFTVFTVCRPTILL